MEGAARALHIVDNVPRARIAAAYAGKKSAISFWEAKKQASELEGSLISAKRMVNLLKLASTLSSSDSTKIKDEEGGIIFTSPNFSWFFEGVSRKELPGRIEGASPAWVDAVLLIGPFPEPVTTMETKEKTSILELPKHLVGKGGIMLLDSGDFSDDRNKGVETIRVVDDAKPISLRDNSGSCLYLDAEGKFTHSSEFSNRKTDPTVPVFIHTQAQKISRLICGLTCTPGDNPRGPQSLIIRLATLNENERMGAVFEFP